MDRIEFETALARHILATTDTTIICRAIETEYTPSQMERMAKYLNEVAEIKRGINKTIGRDEDSR